MIVDKLFPHGTIIEAPMSTQGASYQNGGPAYGPSPLGVNKAQALRPTEPAYRGAGRPLPVVGTGFSLAPGLGAASQRNFIEPHRTSFVKPKQKRLREGAFSVTPMCPRFGVYPYRRGSNPRYHRPRVAWGVGPGY